MTDSGNRNSDSGNWNSDSGNWNSNFGLWKLHWVMGVTVEKFKKIYLFSLCSPRLILTRSPQISGQNMSEAREPEGLVKITYGIVASSLFKIAGKFKLGKKFWIVRGPLKDQMKTTSSNFFQMLFFGVSTNSSSFSPILSVNFYLLNLNGLRAKLIFVVFYIKCIYPRIP